MASKT
jgi:menaquinone-9 beta-reductase